MRHKINGGVAADQAAHQRRLIAAAQGVLPVDEQVDQVVWMEGTEGMDGRPAAGGRGAGRPSG